MLRRERERDREREREIERERDMLSESPLTSAGVPFKRGIRSKLQKFPLIEASATVDFN